MKAKGSRGRGARPLREERGESRSPLPDLDEVQRLARSAGVPIEWVDASELGSVEGPSGRSQGLALEAGPLPELSIEELCQIGDAPRRLVALDGVEDPQNVGAIARVAEASGASGLLLTQRRSPPLSPALARASAGAIEWLPVARVPNLPRALKFLKSVDFWTIGAEVEGSVSLFEAPDRLLEGSQVVVLGAEGRGLRPAVREEIDHPVRIPLAGKVESLNVATAGAVFLFELWRRSTTSTDRTVSS